MESRYHVKANGRNIEKWRLWHEINGTCIYCGKQISLSQFLNGIEADVEHIIPKSVLFDNSFANKTLSHVECNKAKGNKTAYDYMLSLGEDHTQRFSKQVELLFFKPVSGEKETHEGAHCTVGKISKNKYNRLQSSLEDIPKDFILRQLQETRYISKKAKEILNTVCYDVYKYDSQ
ncbi:MAG: HNH endonuclease [Bacteroidetes bacterium]|nr:HNH endonuclease [Bacteroidota bacterium]